MSYADEIQTMRGRQQRKQFVRAVARRLAASSTCPHRGRPCWHPCWQPYMSKWADPIP